MPLTLSSPLSLYSIPVVWAVGYYPALLKGILIRKTIGFNNLAPRGNVARLEKKGVPADIATRAARLEASHQNGIETFPLWAITVLVGNYAGVEHYTLNILALSFIGLRILYNTIYTRQSNKFHGALRTVVWASATSVCIYILLKAANLVRLAQN